MNAPRRASIVPIIVLSLFEFGMPFLGPGVKWKGYRNHDKTANYEKAFINSRTANSDVAGRDQADADDSDAGCNTNTTCNPYAAVSSAGDSVAIVVFGGVIA